MQELFKSNSMAVAEDNEAVQCDPAELAATHLRAVIGTLTDVALSKSDSESIGLVRRDDLWDSLKHLAEVAKILKL